MGLAVGTRVGALVGEGVNGARGGGEVEVSSVRKTGGGEAVDIMGDDGRCTVVFKSPRTFPSLCVSVVGLLANMDGPVILRKAGSGENFNVLERFLGWENALTPS